MRATTAAARCVARALVFGDDARLDTGDFRRARGGRDDDHYGVGDAILVYLYYSLVLVHEPAEETAGFAHGFVHGRLGCDGVVQRRL